MTKSNGAMRWAANFAALSALLYLLALAVSSFSAEAIGRLPFALFFAGVAFGMFKGWRWLAYVAFIGMFVSAILAISNIWTLGAVPGWLYATIASVNLVAVAALFIALWKAPEAAAP